MGSTQLQILLEMFTGAARPPNLNVGDLADDYFCCVVDLVLGNVEIRGREGECLQTESEVKYFLLF